MVYTYYVLVKASRSGEYIARVPGLDLEAAGKDITESIENIKEVVGLWGVCKEELGEDFPKDNKKNVNTRGWDRVIPIEIDFNNYRRFKESKACD